MDRHAPAPPVPRRLADTDLTPSLRLARSSRWARHLARWMVLLLISIVVFTAFAPWQQFVQGNGQVVAFNPLHREQTVQAPVSGRVTRWIPGIREGMRVEKGQTIVEIRDMDPNLLERLEQQVDATRREMEYLQKMSATYESQVEEFRQVRDQMVAAADQYILMAKEKRKAEQQKLQAAQAALVQIETDYKRQKQLAEEGIASTLKLQIADRKFQEATAKVKQARAAVAAADSAVEAKIREREAKAREGQTKIDSATAKLRKAQSDVAKTEKLLLDLNVKLSRQQSQVVTAPWDGFVFRLNTFQQGAIVKKGDALFTIVPDTPDRAVELWLDGNDASWVTTGRHVRLQFEGWPGIQLAGWPSLAINTFGGKVSVIDSTDNGKGQFRILVCPDPNDIPWPSDRFLRQGVQARGLVMLERVPLWFEIWRQLNGFPPVVDVDMPKKKSKGGLLKKLK